MSTVTWPISKIGPWQPDNDEDQDEGDEGDDEGEDEGDGPEGEGKGKGKGKPGGKGKGGEPSDEDGEGGGGGEDDDDGLPGESADDHEPGNAEGAEEDAGEDPSDMPTPGEIDKRAKEIEENMKKAKDASKEDRDKKDKESQQRSEQGPKGKPGTSRGSPEGVDYSKIIPRFNWRTLISRFVATAKPRMEETYAKPARRGISQLDIARQVGAAAIRPAEKVMDYSDMQLCFINDSSGSMSSVTTTIRANLRALLRQPVFKKTVFTMMRFSGSVAIYKASFAQNKAGEVQDVTEMPKQMNLNPETMFSMHDAGGTVFDGKVVEQAAKALKLKYNVLLTTDSDIMYGENKTNLLALIKMAPNQLFIIFDSRETYISFRQATGITTPNITYFG